MKVTRFALGVYLVSPVLVFTLLMYWIAAGLSDPRIHKMPALGAGANDTGGANSIGEFIRHKRESVPVATPVAGHTQDASKPAVAEEMIDPTKLDTGFFLIVRDKSGRAAPSSPIYLAGTCNGWNPGDPKWRLEPQSDMQWRIHVPKQSGGFEFKFTRGSWALEELRADLSVPANRFIDPIPASSVKHGEAPKIELVVERWGDERKGNPDLEARDPYRAIKAAGTVKRLQVQGGVGDAAGTTRDLLVWLPPGYDDPSNATRVYPVLYMFDGQNLFEKHPDVPAEWKADETAKNLVEFGRIEPLVIVGIPHSGATRTAEYLPPAPGVEPIPGVKGEGDRTLEWLEAEVMPRVRASFRVASEPSRVGVGGSSLGGLMALYAAQTRPGVFGRVLAESPALHFQNGAYWRALFEQPGGVGDHRVYIAIGGREGFDNTELSERYLGQVRRVVQTLRRRVAEERHLKYVEVADAVHNEEAWAKRFGDALRFLFPVQAD
ncbi:MAG TPA: alpha/beta hydrolase-fold protein [Phycisphaerales bacterium]|nr:alpha/beta hydrolase-fold protein [Phycisphaerales bacterium]